MKELMIMVMNQDISVSRIPKNVLEEIINPPTDDDGYVHKFYLKEGTKLFIELLTRKED